MQTPTQQQNPEDDAPPRTASTEVRRRRGERPKGAPSTGPTRVEYDEDEGSPRSPNAKAASPTGSKKKKRRKEFTEMDEAGQDEAAQSNPLLAPSARQYEQQPRTLAEAGMMGSNQQAEDEPQDADDAGPTGAASGGKGSGDASWHQFRREVRGSTLNSLVVFHHEKILLLAALIPAILVTVFFGVELPYYRDQASAQGRPLLGDVAKSGIRLVHALAQEQYAAQELQYFHVTSSQQFYLQRSVKFPFYPDVTTPNYARASEALATAISATDQLREQLWIDLSVASAGSARAKDIIAGDPLQSFFDESALEFNRLQMRSGPMSRSDERYRAIILQLITWIGRVVLKGEMFRHKPALAAAYLASAAVGQTAAYRVLLQGLQRTATNNATNPLRLADWYAFVAAFSDEQLYSVTTRMLAQVDPLSASSDSVISRLSESLDTTALGTMVVEDNSALLRSLAASVNEALGDVVNSDAARAADPSEWYSGATALYACLIVAFITAALRVLYHLYRAFAASQERSRDREVKDLERAMDRMKHFVDKISALDVSVLGGKVPRSAPQQELLLRSFLAPMRDLVSFLPRTIIKPPSVVPKNCLDENQLWLPSGPRPYSRIDNLIAVRVDTACFHKAFHAAGAKQRAVQHQAQHALTRLAELCAATDSVLNVHGDHALCFVNLSTAVMNPYTEALYIALGVKQSFGELTGAVLRVSIASAPCLIGHAVTHAKLDPSVAPLSVLNVTGSLDDELEVVTNTVRIHQARVGCSWNFYLGYVKEVSQGSASRAGWTEKAAKMADEVEFKPLECVEAVEATENVGADDVTPMRKSLQLNQYSLRPTETIMLSVSAIAPVGQTGGRKKNDLQRSLRSEVSESDWAKVFGKYLDAQKSAGNRNSFFEELAAYEKQHGRDTTTARLASLVAQKAERAERLTAPDEGAATSRSDLRHAAILTLLFSETT